MSLRNRPSDLPPESHQLKRKNQLSESNLALEKVSHQKKKLKIDDDDDEEEEEEEDDAAEEGEAPRGRESEPGISGVGSKRTGGTPVRQQCSRCSGRL